MDLLFYIRWPWFCIWSSTTFPYTSSHAGWNGQAIFHRPADWIQDQSKKNWSRDHQRASPTSEQLDKLALCTTGKLTYIGHILSIDGGVEKRIEWRFNKAITLLGAWKLYWSSFSTLSTPRSSCTRSVFFLCFCIDSSAEEWQSKISINYQPSIHEIFWEFFGLILSRTLVVFTRKTWFPSSWKDGGYRLVMFWKKKNVL